MCWRHVNHGAEYWSSSCSKIGAGVTNTASKASDEMYESSIYSDKQTEVSNGTPELSTCSEELSKPQNESDEPSEGSDGALVMDEPTNNIASSPEAVQ